MISKPLLHAFDMSALWRQWPKDLDSQRHLILQVYYLLVSLTIGGFCFVHGPMDYLNPNLMALTCVAGLYLLYTFKRLSQRMATHGLLLTSMVLIFYITLNAGGLASPQILWLGMIPVAAIFLLGMKDAQFWSGAVLLSIVSLFVLTFVGWLPAVFWYDRSLITWAGITSLCITSNVFFLPLLYHLLNNKQLKDIEHRNSELENTRIALLQSESHKDKFMAAVGHELRTPMNAILGFNDVLREEVQLQADDLETVQLINQSTLKLLNLINQILDFSQLQAGRMQLFAAPTFLPGLVQHVCDAKQHSEVAKVPIRLQLGATVPEWVQVDAQRLKEVLLHLLDNACKFTSEGHIELRVRVQDTHLLFEVSDTGTGIPLTVLTLPVLAEREFNRNITTNQAREKELLEKRADLLRAQCFKDNFIATLSHELRTPMNAILGFNDLLSVRLKNNPQALALVNLSRQSGEHLLTVINDVLDFSQIQIGHLKIHPEPFDLRTTVRSAFMLFEQRVDSMNIDYQLHLAEDLPSTVNTDRHRLMQVLVNLLGNAIKFTHQGLVSLTVSRDARQLLFEVRDTGIGVAPEKIDKIFERFEQASVQTSSLYGGNGLGLSICRDLVALLGGTIGVNSTLGKGSCFWIRLPLQEASVERLDAADLEPGNHWRDVPVRFLIVDDNPVNRLLACHMVASHWPQAHLTQADNGQQALDLLQAQRFDLVLMDMVMPEMDGIEATQQIRQNLPAPACQIPVVILTANANAQDHQRGLLAGINGLMVKPFDRLQLFALIEEQLLRSTSFLQRLERR